MAAPSEAPVDGEPELRQRFYRAEVYLHDGSQEYDLMGFAPEQIVRDVVSSRAIARCWGVCIADWQYWGRRAAPAFLSAQHYAPNSGAFYCALI